MTNCVHKSADNIHSRDAVAAVPASITGSETGAVLPACLSLQTATVTGVVVLLTSGDSNFEGDVVKQ